MLHFDVQYHDLCSAMVRKCRRSVCASLDANVSEDSGRIEERKRTILQPRGGGSEEQSSIRGTLIHLGRLQLSREQLGTPIYICPRISGIVYHRLIINRTSSARIWIDQICVNQAVLQERTQQVSLMHKSMAKQSWHCCDLEGQTNTVPLYAT
jgi:hypothetical protein